MLVAVWIASARWYIRVGIHPEIDVVIASGRMEVMNFADRFPDMPWGRPTQRTRTMGRCSEPFAWWFEYWWQYGLVRVYCVPLWLPAVLTMLGTTAVWRLDARARRRARVGACAKCGYDRAGLGALSPCPECGTTTLPIGRRGSEGRERDPSGLDRSPDPEKEGPTSSA